MSDFAELQEELRRRSAVTYHAFFDDRSQDITLRFYRIQGYLGTYTLRVAGGKAVEVTGSLELIKGLAVALIVGAISVV